MRLPLLLTTALLSALLLSAPSAAQGKLSPTKQAALEQMLATVDPQMRAMARPQLEQQLSILTDAQVEMMLAGMAQSTEEMDGEAGTAADEGGGEASEEDLAHNRAQYEPAMRSLFDALLAYDRLVTQALAEGLPTKEFAVWGPAWRAEMQALAPRHFSISPDYEMFKMQIEVLAPTDGRYRFDLPRYSTSFDEGAVRAAIARAAREYSAVGEEFLAQARPLVKAEKFEEADQLARKANARADAIRKSLEQSLALQEPSVTTLQMALGQGQRIR